jgi:hypothetical protein
MAKGHPLIPDPFPTYFDTVNVLTVAIETKMDKTKHNTILTHANRFTRIDASAGN